MYEVPTHALNEVHILKEPSLDLGFYVEKSN